MAAIARFLIIIPLGFALISFVLTSLTLFAGYKQGFMEDFAVVRLNASMIGHYISDRIKDFENHKDTNDHKGDEGLLGNFKDWFDNKKGEAKDQLNSYTDDIALKIAQKLGLAEWYSLHLTDFCEGSFKPDTTAPNAAFNVTNCTHSSPSYRLNITKILDQKLKAGPFNISLSDIDWPGGIQNKLDVLNHALLTLIVLFATGTLFSALSILCNIGVLLRPKGALVLINLIVASLGAASCTLGSIVISAAGRKSVEELNEEGKLVGLSAQQGSKFLSITWVSSVLMLSLMVFWTWNFLLARRQKETRSGRNQDPRSKRTDETTWKSGAHLKEPGQRDAKSIVDRH